MCNAILVHENEKMTFNFDNISSWRSLVRGMARAKKLANLFKNTLSIKARLRSASRDHNLAPLTVADLQLAEGLIIKVTQEHYYAEEIECLRARKAIYKTSELYRLNCFLDGNQILRVGGRLKFSNLYSVYKQPVVLPKKAHISTLLIRDCHQSISTKAVV